VAVDRSRGALWAAGLLMAALGTFHAWSVLVQPLQDELHASRSAVSAVYALATAVFAASMLLEPAVHRRLPAVALGAGSALLAAAGLAAPELSFLCTVQLARRRWGQKRNDLASVCRRLGIGLIHHDAGSDAEACARIVIAASAAAEARELLAGHRATRPGGGMRA
jgi:hypothetical protein